MHFTHFFKDFQVFFCYSDIMIHFFRLILLIFCVIATAVTTHAETPFKSFQKELQEGLKKAYNGRGTTIKNYLGESQLLSCKTGIKDTSRLITGIQVKLNKGWILKNPVITATADNYTPTPIKQIRSEFPISKKWTDTYNTPIVFPILLEGSPQKDITLTVKTDWSVCPPLEDKDQTCFPQHGTYTLSLPVTENYATVYCGYLSSELKTAAVDIKKIDSKVQNSLLPNGNLMLRFIFPKENKWVDFQSEDSEQLSVLSTQKDKNIWTFILEKETPFVSGKSLPLLLRTANGYYSADIQIDDKPLPFLPKNLSIWNAFWMGLFFFILSPIWCYWLAPYKLADKAKNLVPEIKKLQITYGIALLILGILWCFKVPLYSWTDYIALDWMIFILGLYFLFNPFQPVLMIGILTILLPKPFWNFIEDISMLAKIGLLLWFFLLPYCLFNLWKIQAKNILSVFKKFQKTNATAYNIFVRLPYIVLIVWFGITLTLSSLQRIETTLIKNIDTPVIISVNQPISLSALKNNLFVFSSLKDFPVYYLNSKHDWAKQKKAEYNLHQKDFNVLITTEGNEIILPRDLSLHQLKQFIRQYY